MFRQKSYYHSFHTQRNLYHEQICSKIPALPIIGLCHLGEIFVQLSAASLKNESV